MTIHKMSSLGEADVAILKLMLGDEPYGGVLPEGLFWVYSTGRTEAAVGFAIAPEGFSGIAPSMWLAMISAPVGSEGFSAPGGLRIVGAYNGCKVLMDSDDLLAWRKSL